MAPSHKPKHLLYLWKYKDQKAIKDDEESVCKGTSPTAVQPGLWVEVGVAGDGSVRLAADPAGFYRLRGVHLIVLWARVRVLAQKLRINLLQLFAFQPERLCTPARGNWFQAMGYVSHINVPQDMPHEIH